MRTKLRRLVPDALCAIPALVVVLLAAHGSLGIRVGTAASAPSQDGQGPQLPLAAAFTDDPLVPGVTQVRAVHVTELRSRIDSLRVLRRLRTFGWAEPALNRGVPIRAVHLLDLRTALADAYIAVGLPAPAYSGPALTAGGMIRAAHITELRAAVTALESTEPLLKMCSTSEPVLASGFTTNAAGLFDCKWRDRSSLTVTFLDGDPVIQNKVKSVALEWSVYTHITLNFVSPPNADIRISFLEKGQSFSQIGSCTSAGRTMNFGWFTPTTSDTEYHRTVLHEFGHAFGLIHEHQSPAANIPWDRPRVYEWCAAAQKWDTATCDRNMFDRPARTNYTEFDPHSIMLYPIDNSLTIGDYSTPSNTALSFFDQTFTTTWYTNGPWTNWTQPENQYLVGNWDAGTWASSTYRGDKLAVRRDHYVLMSLNYDGVHDFVQGYGFGNSESEYLAGDWDGDGKTNLAVRRGNCVNMDFNFDGAHDRQQCYGNGASEDQYLVGDWDGDGRDNLAVRRGNCVNMDFNFDGAYDRQQCYGNGASEDQYLVGDWDGDGRDNLAVRRGNCVNMDFNFDGAHDKQQCYGFGNSEGGYYVGDWDGDGKDNLAVRRGNCFNMDFNFDGAHDRQQCYGNGLSVLASPQALGRGIRSWLAAGWLFQRSGLALGLLQRRP